MVNILYVFGICGMIMGSLHAIGETDTRRMIAYSSVAQIGYIYMGIGLGTTAGMVAAVFHIFAHSATKALLFISAVGLYKVSGDRKDFVSLRGAAFRNPLAGVGFGIGALSMVGFPMLSGFISKLLFATSALDSQDKMLPTLFVLALSTLLNAVYFLRLMITLYSRRRPEDKPLPEYTKAGNFWGLKFSIVCFIILNLVLGMYSQPIVQAITDGLAMFD